MTVIMTRVIGIQVTVEAHSEIACERILTTIEDRLYDHTPKKNGMVDGIKHGSIKRVAIVEDNRG